MGHSRPLFIYFVFSIQVNKQKINLHFADVRSRTTALRYWKWPLYQLSHNHFPAFLVSYVHYCSYTKDRLCTIAPENAFSKVWFREYSSLRSFPYFCVATIKFIQNSIPNDPRHKKYFCFVCFTFEKMQIHFSLAHNS